uniref:Spermatid nuclear transition protein 3-like n=2 Tax=Capra hircus TaxID=9925 RepID=A0A452EBD6_CAPHI
MKGRKKTLWQRRYRGSVKARNMTVRVRRPLKGTLRKKIRSYATPSKKVKKTREPNCFLRSCAREKRNQSRKRYQNVSQSQRRRQNQKRR